MALLLALPALAAPPPPTVAKALHEAGIPEQYVAIYLRETGATKPLLEHQSRAPLSPASTMKLVTTYAALELLGPAYTWQTGLLAETAPQNGMLEGDLYLKGSGDPALTIERFWLLLRDLRQLGVRELRGDLILDDSRFAAPGGDPGAFDNAPLRPYNALPDALLVNFKSTRFRLLPGDNGTGVRLIADPAPPQLVVENRLRGVEGECGDWREGIETSVERNGGATVKVAFSGDYPLACGERNWHLALFDNTTYVSSLFRLLWEEMGGVLRGAAKRGVTPAAARLLASSESRQLADVVRDVNKFSNNVMARQLLLTLGNGSSEAGAQALNAWLAEKGQRFPELAIENGSGLSRRERISAEHLGELLAAAWRSPVMAEFVASLPIAGIDGTMKKRLVERGVAGHAHIKTGSLKGVKAIAGYVHDRKGRQIVAVFLINHPNAAAGQAAQDALLEWIYQRP
ncbi:MAG: D-alanyl-D-alanine carboxypeptidase/D-alanyl-D-alanine-endopeptidase [Sulfuricella sp.]|nr:D-alanyl-D-alanine carboxypeptidase/D-alanyl-D-alanine-endopeptidase [Sulfuricella sp.]